MHTYMYLHAISMHNSIADMARAAWRLSTLSVMLCVVASQASDPVIDTVVLTDALMLIHWYCNTLIW